MRSGKKDSSPYQTVKVRKDLVKKLGHLAIDLEITVQDLVGKAIEFYLARKSPKTENPAVTGKSTNFIAS